MTVTQTPVYKIRPNLTNVELETIISALRHKVNTDAHWNADLELLEKLVMLKASNDAKHGLLLTPAIATPATPALEKDSTKILKKSKLLGVESLSEEEKIVEIKHRAETGQELTEEEQKKLNDYLMSQL